MNDQSSGGQPNTEEELIARSLSGDETALELLLLRYYDRLLNYIRQKMPAKIASRVSPEDILQQTYMKAFRAIGGFEPREKYSFFSWLKRIADNEQKDQFRKSQREAIAPAPTAGHGDSSYAGLVEHLADDGDKRASVVAREKELTGVLHVKLASMKPTYRQAVELYCLQGRSLEEVAGIMDLTTGQVRGLVHRAKASLRGAIDRLSHFV